MASGDGSTSAAEAEQFYSSHRRPGRPAPPCGN